MVTSTGEIKQRPSLVPPILAIGSSIAGRSFYEITTDRNVAVDREKLDVLHFALVGFLLTSRASTNNIAQLRTKAVLKPV
jgi:hypothetical protein